MPHKRFLAVSLNPVMQRTLLFESWKENRVNRTHTHFLHASGKGVNVARVLTQLEDEVVHITHAGGEDRERFLAMCREDGLILAAVESASQIRTCVTLLSREKGSTTELIADAGPVGPDTDSMVREEFAKRIMDCDFLIISGTKAPGYSGDLYPWMVKKASALGVYSVLDIKGADLRACLHFGPGLIKPNLSEFCATFLPELAVEEHEEDDKVLEYAAEEMKRIHREYGSLTVLTLGASGALGWDGKELIRQPARQITPVNTIGCGDAFTAGLSHSLAKDEGFARALETARDCAAANAGFIKPGVIA
ncbi:PfkB family carbohydrate kinase [Marispirochaeta aestuarii]|uniref:1-phosphofructokinase family hexose kinase n=1 Tax=Marispirochaeta aestuarii TaxID=1963862 RepID=UPI0029C9670F|nr:PfkB family carbohydrate kinase [Marispirochaeta aestuarii]